MRYCTILLAALSVAGCASMRLPEQPTADQAVEMLSTALAAESIPPLTAAGVLAANGWDCIEFGDRRAWWCWSEPTTGSPVERYLCQLWFTTTDTTFRYWLDPAACETESLRVAGIDSLGRMGPWSYPGACADPTQPTEVTP